MADEPTEHPEDQIEPTEPAADTPAASEQTPVDAGEETSEQPLEAEAALVSEQPIQEQTVAAEEGAPEQPVAEEAAPSEQPVAEEPAAQEPAAQEPVAAEPVPEETAAQEPAGDPVAEKATVQEPSEDVGEADTEEEPPTPRVKPSVPGAHLEVDIVPEGVDPLAPEKPSDPYAIEEDDESKSEEDTESGQLSQPISSAAIDLAAGARYKATGKRKTAIARVILRPGSGAYLVNGRTLDEHFPRVTLQRNIRQPLETVGYEERMDVVARLHGGGISAQAGALRHGISRALLEADPNLRGELKRRGFLTRDSRAKERKKAGLKKARKRPQFSKR
jgi:small subunit ribosomal protein S9